MIRSLTSLRGIFILFIFFHHCLNLYAGGGTMAVTFFFVLGGFSMTLGYKDRVMSPEFDYRKYITRRAIKFYPLHWLTLLAALPFAVVSFDKWTFPMFTVNTALLHSWIPIKSVYFSFNAVSWCLANTMFFAVMFPFVLRFFLNMTSKGSSIMLSVIIIYIILAIILPREWYHAILYISPYVRLTDFILGIFLALGYMKLRNKIDTPYINNVLWHMLIISLMVLLVVESCLLSETVRLVSPVYWIFVAALILITSLRGGLGGYNLFENKYLHRLGELSFTIFMTHQLILKYSRVFHFENDIFYVVYALAMTIVISIVIDKYILNPITQWLTKRFQPSMTARS